MEDFNLESLNLEDLNSISGGGLTEERKEYFHLLFKQMKKGGLTREEVFAKLYVPEIIDYFNEVWDEL